MLFLLTFFLSLFPFAALAYIDPGTGSMIVQGIIAALATGLLFFKIWWLRIKAFFCRKDKQEEQPDTHKADEDDSA